MNKTITALALSVLVSACGSETNKESKTPAHKPHIAVHTNGLDVTERISLSTNGVNTNFLGSQFALPHLFSPGETVKIAVTASPEGKDCTVSQAMPFTVSENNSANVVTVNCTTGDYSGYVQDYNTDARIDDVTVQVVAFGEVQSTVTTNDTGYYQFSAVVDADRYVLNFSAPGYGDYSTIYYAGQALEPVSLVSVSASASFSLNSPLDMLVAVPQQQVDIAVVSLPANSLVTENGSPASGNAEAIITLIDPSNNANLMPGNYTTLINDDNDVASIESFGAVDIVFKDDEGNKLQLADGQTATIRIPIASGRDPFTAPSIIPLFYFDTTTGHWVEEGTATKHFSPDGAYYEGSVSHFTTWNADRVIDTVYIKGCVTNNLGEKLGNVKIVSSGVDYIGSATTYSDSLGQFEVAARKDSQLFLTAISQSLSSLLSVTTQGVDLQLPACLQLNVTQAQISLSWGQYPKDLDAHFWGPLNTDSDERFHIYYSESEKVVNGAYIALDVDDTSSFGPEIIHLSRFPYAGTYSYYVHHYSNEEQVEPEQVKFSWGDNLKTITSDINDRNGKRCWHVFDVYVDEESEISQSVTDEWVTADGCNGDIPPPPVPPI